MKTYYALVVILQMNFVFLELNHVKAYAQLADTMLCADESCSETISEGEARLAYRPRDDKFLPLKKGDVVIVKSKNAGRKSHLWGGQDFLDTRDDGSLKDGVYSGLVGENQKITIDKTKKVNTAGENGKKDIETARTNDQHEVPKQGHAPEKQEQGKVHEPYEDATANQETAQDSQSQVKQDEMINPQGRVSNTQPVDEHPVRMKRSVEEGMQGHNNPDGATKIEMDGNMDVKVHSPPNTDGVPSAQQGDSMEGHQRNDDHEPDVGKHVISNEKAGNDISKTGTSEHLTEEIDTSAIPPDLAALLGKGQKEHPAHKSEMKGSTAGEDGLPKIDSGSSNDFSEQKQGDVAPASQHEEVEKSQNHLEQDSENVHVDPAVNDLPGEEGKHKEQTDQIASVENSEEKDGSDEEADTVPTEITGIAEDSHDPAQQNESDQHQTEEHKQVHGNVVSDDRNDGVGRNEEVHKSSDFATLVESEETDTPSQSGDESGQHQLDSSKPALAEDLGPSSSENVGDEATQPSQADIESKNIVSNELLDTSHDEGEDLYDDEDEDYYDDELEEKLIEKAKAASKLVRQNQDEASNGDNLDDKIGYTLFQNNAHLHEPNDLLLSEDSEFQQGMHESDIKSAIASASTDEKSVKDSNDESGPARDDDPDVSKHGTDSTDRTDESNHPEVVGVGSDENQSPEQDLQPLTSDSEQQFSSEEPPHQDTDTIPKSDVNNTDTTSGGNSPPVAPSTDPKLSEDTPIEHSDSDDSNTESNESDHATDSENVEMSGKVVDDSHESAPVTTGGTVEGGVMQDDHSTEMESDASSGSKLEQDEGEDAHGSPSSAANGTVEGGDGLSGQTAESEGGDGLSGQTAESENGDGQSGSKGADAQTASDDSGENVETEQNKAVEFRPDTETEATDDPKVDDKEEVETDEVETDEPKQKELTNEGASSTSNENQPDASSTPRDGEDIAFDGEGHTETGGSVYSSDEGEGGDVPEPENDMKEDIATPTSMKQDQSQEESDNASVKMPVDASDRDEKPKEIIESSEQENNKDNKDEKSINTKQERLSAEHAVGSDGELKDKVLQMKGTNIKETVLKEQEQISNSDESESEKYIPLHEGQVVDWDEAIDEKPDKKSVGWDETLGDEDEDRAAQNTSLPTEELVKDEKDRDEHDKEKQDEVSSVPDLSVEQKITPLPDVTTEQVISAPDHEITPPGPTVNEPEQTTEETAATETLERPSTASEALLDSRMEEEADQVNEMREPLDVEPSVAEDMHVESFWLKLLLLCYNIPYDIIYILEPFFNLWVSLLPKEYQNDFYGVSWSIVLSTFFVGFMLIWIMTCRMSSVKRRKKDENSTRTIQELKTQLEDLSQEKVGIENELRTKENEIEIQQEQIVSASREKDQVSMEKRGLEHTLKGYATENEGLKQNVQDLNQSIQEKDKAMQDILSNSQQVEKSLLAQQEAIARYEAEIRQLQASLETHQSSVKQTEASSEKLKERIKTLEKTKGESKKEGKALKEQIDKLNSEIGDLQEKLTSQIEESEQKSQEIDVLKDCVLQFKGAQEYLTDEGDDAESEDAVEKQKERMKSMIDVSNVKAILRQTETEKLQVSYELEEERKSRLDVEAKISELEASMQSDQAMKNKLEREKQNLESKLTVMQEFYAQREVEIQSKLGLEKSKRESNETLLEDRDKQQLELLQQLEAYKKMSEEAKRNYDNAERQHKQEILGFEKKAHDNWIACRDADRKCEEANKQISLLQLELRDVRMRLRDSEREPILRPRPERHGPPGAPPPFGPPPGRGPPPTGSPLHFRNGPPPNSGRRSPPPPQRRLPSPGGSIPRDRPDRPPSARSLPPMDCVPPPGPSGHPYSNSPARDARMFRDLMPPIRDMPPRMRPPPGARMPGGGPMTSSPYMERPPIPSSHSTGPRPQNFPQSFLHATPPQSGGEGLRHDDYNSPPPPSSTEPLPPSPRQNQNDGSSNPFRRSKS